MEIYAEFVCNCFIQFEYSFNPFIKKNSYLRNVEKYCFMF